MVKDMEPDKAMIRSTVTKLVAEDKDVVVVSHSYGGAPSNSSLEGLSKTERAKAGKKGGVIKSCMISAFLLDVGKTTLGGRDPPGWTKQEGETILANDTDKTFYTDVPAAEAKYWASQLLPHARITFDLPVTYAAWKIIPVNYLLCEQDNAIPLEAQQQMCEDARNAGGIVETESINAGHSPFLSQPDVVANWIRRAAGVESVANGHP